MLHSSRMRGRRKGHHTYQTRLITRSSVLRRLAVGIVLVGRRPYLAIEAVADLRADRARLTVEADTRLCRSAVPGPAIVMPPVLMVLDVMHMLAGRLGLRRVDRRKRQQRRADGQADCQEREPDREFAHACLPEGLRDKPAPTKLIRRPKSNF